MNVVQTDRGQLLEVQATAERSPFSRHQLGELLKLADKGIREIIAGPEGGAQEEEPPVHGLRRALKPRPPLDLTRRGW